VVLDILNSDNIEGTWVLLTVGNNTNTSNVTSLGDHAEVSSVELNKVDDLSGLQIDFRGITNLDIWVWVADGASIVGNNVWDTFFTGGVLGDLAKFVSAFLFLDLVELVTSFDVIEKTEVVVGAFKLDNIHETGWVVRISSNFTVDLDVLLHANFGDFGLVKSVFESVSKDKDDWKTFTELVRTGGWTRCPSTSHLIKHPVFWCC